MKNCGRFFYLIYAEKIMNVMYDAVKILLIQNNYVLSLLIILKTHQL